MLIIQKRFLTSSSALVLVRPLKDIGVLANVSRKGKRWRVGFTVDKIKLKRLQEEKGWRIFLGNILQIEANTELPGSHWTPHAVRTYQPSLHPFQAFLAEPKVGVSIAAGSSHGDHSLVPLGLYPDHRGGAEALSEWY